MEVALETCQEFQEQLIHLGWAFLLNPMPGPWEQDLLPQARCGLFHRIERCPVHGDHRIDLPCDK